MTDVRLLLTLRVRVADDPAILLPERRTQLQTMVWQVVSDILAHADSRDGLLHREMLRVPIDMVSLEIVEELE